MRRAVSLLMVVGFLGAGGLGYLAGSRHALAPSHAAADAGCQTFAQTGHTVCGDFLAYWQTNGGLAQQGYPISDVFDEVSDTDGITHKVQYFERAVFEAHPENQPPNNVLLSLLGSQKYKAKYLNAAASPSASPSPSTVKATASPVAAARGQSVTFTATTVAGWKCNFLVSYNVGTAAGVKSSGDLPVPSSGSVSWLWTVAANADPGTALMDVTCAGSGGQQITARATVQIM